MKERQKIFKATCYSITTSAMLLMVMIFSRENKDVFIACGAVSIAFFYFSLINVFYYFFSHSVVVFLYKNLILTFPVLCLLSLVFIENLI